LKALIQRVDQAEVAVRGKSIASIKQGLLVFLGIYKDDTKDDVFKVCKKILNLRIFNDENDKINYNIQDIGGKILLVSQFTLCANIKKGNRPSFVEAMEPSRAEKLFNNARDELSNYISTVTGQFGAMMTVSLTNNGPMTIMVDTK
tara:strand:- start:336 stop:773 length:438 start_codon:yes stop_codon:yes gene_type:complete